jgi:hypothetical protein
VSEEGVQDCVTRTVFQSRVRAPHQQGSEKTNTTVQLVAMTLTKKWNFLKRDTKLVFRNWIPLSTSKNIKKNLDVYIFVTLDNLFFLKIDVNVTTVSNNQSNFCWHLESH